eukprot:g81727.t1
MEISLLSRASSLARRYLVRSSHRKTSKTAKSSVFCGRFTALRIPGETNYSRLEELENPPEALVIPSLSVKKYESSSPGQVSVKFRLSSV